jgi:WD40 repeat protein
MTSSRESFYITGGTLPATASCYVERAADSEILQGILSGAYVYVLDSRQMGKSSISVRTLLKLKDAGVRTAFVDLTKFGVRNLTAEQWFAAMVREVERDLGMSPKLTEYWRANADLAPVQRFFGALQDCALAETPDRIAIFIDEIDVTRSLPFDTDEFFAGIRQCYIGRATNPELSRMTFSLFGTATPAELIEDTRVSPFNIGQRIELQDFSYEEAAVLAKNLPGDRTAVLRRILYWTGGHPYLTQRLCELVSRPDSPHDVDAACKSLFLERRAKESDDNLAFVRNRLLKNDLDLAALLELYRKVRSDKLVRDDETNPLCSLLRMSGITRSENGRLKVRNRIYSQVFDREWILKHLPDAESRRQRAAYRKGLIRATGIAAALILVVGGLALYGFSEARVARAALSSAGRYASSLTNSEQALRASLQRRDEALNLAETRRASADAAQLRASRSATLAKESAVQAARQGTLAKSAAIDARNEAVDARSASSLADSRLSRSFVATGMQRLDTGDPAGAIEPLMSALKLDQNDPHRAFLHRLRLGYALRAASNLRQVWSGAGQMIDAEFLPDHRVITANLDGSVRVWNAETGASALTPIVQPSLTCIALSKDGRNLLTGDLGGRALWWDLRTGKLLHSFRVRGQILCLEISEDRQRAAIADRTFDGKSTVSVWNLVTGVRLPDAFNAVNANVVTMAFSPNRKRLVVGSDNFIAYSVDQGDGLGDHPISTCFTARRAQFLRGGKLILINGADWNNYRFDLGAAQLCRATGAPLVKYKVPSPQDGFGTIFRLSQDGESVLVSTNSGTLQLYALRTGARLGPAIRSSAEISDCDVSPNGALIAAASTDGAVRTWKAASGELVGSLLWHGSGVNKVRFDATGSRLLTCSNDGTARLWNLYAAGLNQTVAGPGKLQGEPRCFWTPGGALVAAGIDSLFRWEHGRGWKSFLPGYRVIFANDEQEVVSRRLFAKGDAIRVYDFDREKFLTPLLASSGFSRKQSCFGLSPDGRFLYDEYKPRHIKLIDLDREARTVSEIVVPYPLRLKTFFFGATDDRSRVVGVEIDSHADRVITDGGSDDGRGGGLDLWALSTGKHVASLHWEGLPYDCFFNPDGSNYVAIVNRRGTLSLRAYRSTDGKELSPQLSYPEGLDAQFTADGARFLIALPFSLWDAHTWRQIASDPVPQGPVSRAERGLANRSGIVIFKPTTRRLYSSKTGLPISPSLLSAAPKSFDFSEDGQYLSVCTQTDIYVFNLRANCRKVGPIYVGSSTKSQFAPGTDLLCTNTASRVKFWDPQTGEEVLPAMRGGVFEPAFSPNGKWFACNLGEDIAVSELPSGDPSVARLETETHAVSQSSMEKIDASGWKALRRDFPDLYAVRNSLPDEESSTEKASYSVDDAIRDTGLHFDDAQEFIDAAQVEARAALWGEAERSIGEAVRRGAQGAGVFFLQGLASLHAKQYAASEEVLKRAATASDSHTISTALFQAAVGARDYSSASAEFEKSIVGESVSLTLSNSADAILARAAEGETAAAKLQLSELVDKAETGSSDQPTGLLLLQLASAEATLNMGSIMDVKVLNGLKDYRSESRIQLSVMLELARTQQYGSAEKDLAELSPANSDPQCMMARALLLKRKGVGAYKSALQGCFDGCNRIAVENDVSSLDAALTVLQAVIIGREARARLDSLSLRP